MVKIQSRVLADLKPILLVGQISWIIQLILRVPARISLSFSTLIRMPTNFLLSITNNGTASQAAVILFKPDIILLDLWLSDMIFNGVECVKRVQELPSVPFYNYSWIAAQRSDRY